MGKQDQAKAFVVRLRPGGVRDNLPLALENDFIGPGWGEAFGLIEEKDYFRFREIIRETHYPNDQDNVRSGRSAGMVWQFINGMSIGDYVVVPRPYVFYVAQIISE